MALLLAGSAPAAPHELSRGGDDPAFTLLGDDAAGCKAKPGALCFVPGDAATTALPTEAVAAASKRRGSVPPPRFARPSGAAATWTVEARGRLARPALAGNAVFLFYDLDDKEAIAEGHVTHLLQGHLPRGNQLGVRLSLSPEDGFRAGHSYRMRVVQLLGGKEIVLAEGELTLL